MNLVHTFEFTVISILYLFTIIQTMSLIYGTKEYRRKYVTVFLMYLISGIICSWYRNHNKPVIFLTATICYYAFTNLHFVNIQIKKIMVCIYFGYCTDFRFYFPINWMHTDWFICTRFWQSNGFKFFIYDF